MTDELTTRERFARVIRFHGVDRMPVFEWAPWWDQTLRRWEGEGLPAGLHNVEIQQHFGLDLIWQLRMRHHSPDTPKPTHHGAGLIEDEAGYEAILPTLYPDEFDFTELRRWARLQAAGELVIWLTVDGFFWYPRTLFGIERHLFAFYDQPGLMQRMNADLLAHQQKILDAVLAVCTPDFMTFAEDMSYNHGPMIGRELFDEFLAPYYRQIVPRLRDAGIPVFIDSDGDVTDLVDWLTGVGAEGFLPLERMAGVDVAQMRRRWPTLKMLGAYDKTVMHRGDAAVREEFERLLPVMRSGGFIACVDHQTPPGVSLSQYCRFVEIFGEYAVRAANHP